VREPGWGAMFQYREWLQTSPPLFLLLERGAIAIFGLSSSALRAVPLALAMAAAWAMWAASRRLLPWPVGLVASALLVTNPTLIEYSRTAKQYSGEVAASALLLWSAAALKERPARALWVAAIAPLLGYSSVFLLPGLALALLLCGHRRQAAGLTAVAGVELGALYWWFLRPNYSPELRAFWAADADGGWTPALALAAFMCIACAVTLCWRLRDEWFSWVCVLPCLLLALSATVGWYPANPRTRLFALPCFLLLLARSTSGHRLSACVRFSTDPYARGSLPKAACTIALALGALSLWRQVAEHRAAPQEDYAQAVSYLREHMAPADLLLVHAAAREGFLLYASIERWTPARVEYGATGWPCCARGHDARPGISSKDSVLRDLDAKIPPGFRGRIWLLYPTRPSHWSYAGLNEGDLWRNHVWDRGCPPGPYVALANLAISPMNCGR